MSLSPCITPESIAALLHKQVDDKVVLHIGGNTQTCWITGIRYR